MLENPIHVALLLLFFGLALLYVMFSTFLKLENALDDESRSFEQQHALNLLEPRSFLQVTVWDRYRQTMKVLRSDPFEPYLFQGGRMWTTAYSSRQLAETAALRIAEGGHFEHLNILYPNHQILQVEVCGGIPTKSKQNKEERQS